MQILSFQLIIVSVCLSFLAWILAISNALVGVGAFGLAEIVPWLGIGTFNLRDSRKADALDKSNDDAALMTTHQLIERAGFIYENYYAVADDGYITELIRIINPLADTRYLKGPPMLIQHGQTSDSGNFVMQSNAQHHPMKWPPTEMRSNNDSNHDNYSEYNGDKIVENFKPSSNRSLAFMLANNGYDVWLSSVRGVDGNNRGFLGKRVALNTVNQDRNMVKKNMTPGEGDLLIHRIDHSYWSFTLDDQIAHEVPSQIDLVMKVTGSDRITLIGYSNTALTTFAMLSIRPDIAAHVDTVIAIAPVVYYNKLDGWFKWLMEEFMQLIPKQIDYQLFLNDRVASFLRRVTIRACSNVRIRYTMCKLLINLLFGQSAQFRSNLELPIFNHLFRPTTWKCLAQHLQIVKSHRLAKFDYGATLNKRYYGTWLAPEYKLSQLDPRVRVALVSGDKDCWANQATLDKVRAKLPMKPALDLVVRDYNHLDLTCAFDLDIRVNLPILRFLDSHYGYKAPSRAAGDAYEAYGNKDDATGARYQTDQVVDANWIGDDSSARDAE